MFSAATEPVSRRRNDGNPLAQARPSYPQEGLPEVKLGILITRAVFLTNTMEDAMPLRPTHHQTQHPRAPDHRINSGIIGSAED
jgi:hypothetical protein